MSALLDRIDAYCDGIPRGSARAVAAGSLVVFLREGEGWPFYARPGRGGEPTAADVERARAVLRNAGAPESFEWIDEVAPAMRAAAAAGGLAVHDHPLMVYVGEAGRGRRASGADVRIATPDDDLRSFQAVASVGFAHAGTAVGSETEEELGAPSLPGLDAAEGERIEAGRLVRGVALVDGRPVATGVHQPLDGVTEIAGVATLPSARRRGLGGAVTALLVEDALRRGIHTIFLTAGSDEIARIYASLGFRRVGTSCIAGPAER